MPSGSMTSRRRSAAVVVSLCLVHNAASFTSVPLRSAAPPVTKTNLFASSIATTQEGKTEEEEKQIVRLIDPRSNREVILVGCMHYNPASIQLAEKTAVDAVNSLSSSSEESSSSFPSFFNFMRKEEEQGGLAAVLVESCRTRWDAANKFRSETLQEPWQQEIYDKVLPNEMRAAANVAKAEGIPVVLGDQAIETTGDRVKATLKQTLKDLATPLDGGWDRIGEDVKVGFGVISNSFGAGSNDNGEENNQSAAGRLTAQDFLDTKLLFGMPASLARYPLGILVRFPKFGLALLSLSSALDYASGQLAVSSSDPLVQTLVTSFVGTSAAVVDDASPLSWTVSFLIAALETIVFARVFMLPILAERDLVLAKSIVATCAATGGQRGNSEAVELYRDILDEKDTASRKSSSNGAVVAVLGAAHVNGVRDIILNGVEDDALLRL